MSVIKPATSSTASAAELEKLFLTWRGESQHTRAISKSVCYLGHFTIFGDIFAKQRLWRWSKTGGAPVGVAPNLRSLAYQEKALDKALAELKDCVILSTTPTYFSQYQQACLLKQRGFQLLEGKCYRHPGYPSASIYNPEHPGIPDRHQHWEHIWWKVQGEPKELGLPTMFNQLNNCGVDSCNGLEAIEVHDKSDRKNYLTVAWLPRGTPFPKGWKRFFSGTDYKLGVNFDLIDRSWGSKVKVCDHNFDMKIFEGWEPNFDNWSPS